MHYRLFARYMNTEYKPIPSSIIDRRRWNLAWSRSDRGDMAMIAYGAGAVMLLHMVILIRQKVLWPLIEWCLEYLKQQYQCKMA